MADVSKFYTTKNESEGVWYELKFSGMNTGIEVKLYGILSDAAVLADEAYDKEIDEAEKESDVIKRAHLRREALIKRNAAMISDIRGKDGTPLEMDGKPLEYSRQAVEELLRNSRELMADLMKAIGNSKVFMTKKD